MRPSRRTWKFIALGLGAVMAVWLIASAIVSYRASARLKKKIDELRAAGEPVSLAELARPAIPPDDNAATYIRRAKPAIEAIEKEVAAAPDADSDTLYQGPLSENMKKILRDAFAGQPGVLDLLRRAAACSDYDSQLDYGNYQVDTQKFIEAALPNLQESRGAIRVLSYHAALLIDEGQPEESLRAALAALWLSRLFDRNPLIVGHLVSLACRGVALDSAHRALRAGTLPESVHELLEEELAKHDLTAAWRHALTTERPYGLQAIRELNLRYAPWPLGTIADECLFLDAFAAAIRDAGLEPVDEQQPSEAEQLLNRAGTVTALLNPALQATRSATARVTALLRALRVLNALQRYEQHGHAHEPELKDLGLPANATTDPYTGQPLHIKKLPEGWVVYSVGRDHRDDGGVKLNLFEEGDDTGWGPLKAH